MTPLVFHPIYSQLPLPPRHRFPIEKYQGIRDALVAKGIDSDRFSAPSPVSTSLLNDYFAPDYVNALVSGVLDDKAMRRGDHWDFTFMNGFEC